MASAILSPGIILGGGLNIILPSDKIDQVFLALSISYGAQMTILLEGPRGNLSSIYIARIFHNLSLGIQQSKSSARSVPSSPTSTTSSPFISVSLAVKEYQRNRCWIGCSFNNLRELPLVSSPQNRRFRYVELAVFVLLRIIMLCALPLDCH